MIHSVAAFEVQFYLNGKTFGRKLLFETEEEMNEDPAVLFVRRKADRTEKVTIQVTDLRTWE